MLYVVEGYRLKTRDGGIEREMPGQARNTHSREGSGEILVSERRPKVDDYIYLCG